jgi:hypothetical protein
MLSVIWPRGFSGEGFSEIDQLKTKIAYGSHVRLQIETK